jgi:hypothetical protein
VAKLPATKLGAAAARVSAGPSGLVLRPCYLFQIAGDTYTVVDTVHATSFGPQPYAALLERYPGFADVAIPVGRTWPKYSNKG